MHWNGGEKYNVVGYVGKGAFAMVFKLSSKRDGEVFAAKQIEKRRFIKDGIVGHAVHNELDVMETLDHVSTLALTRHTSDSRAVKHRKILRPV